MRRLATGSEIRAVRRNGTGDRRLVRSNRHLGSPGRRDGTRLAFELWDGVDTELYRLSVASASLRRLTRNNINDFGPVWGPGSSRIAFTRLSGGSNDVWTIRADGTDPKRLTTAATHDAVAAWGAGP